MDDGLGFVPTSRHAEILRRIDNLEQNLGAQLDDIFKSVRQQSGRKRGSGNSEDVDDDSEGQPIKRKRATKYGQSSVVRLESTNDSSRLYTLITALDITLAQSLQKPDTHSSSDSHDEGVVNVLSQIEGVLLSSAEDRAVLCRNHSWWLLIALPLSQLSSPASAQQASLMALSATISNRYKKTPGNTDDEERKPSKRGREAIKWFAELTTATWLVSDSKLLSNLTQLLRNTDPTIFTAAAALTMCVGYAIRTHVADRDALNPPWTTFASPDVCRAVVDRLQTYSNEGIRTSNPEGLRYLLGILSVIRPASPITLYNAGVCEAVCPFLRSRNRADHKTYACHVVHELCMSSKESQTALGEKGACKSLADLVACKNDEMVFQALRAVFALCFENPANAAIFTNTSLCERLPGLLATTNVSVQITALCTVSAIAAVDANARLLAERGAIDGAVRLLSSENHDVGLNAATALEKLANGHSENIRYMVQQPDLFKSLFDLVKGHRNNSAPTTQTIPGHNKLIASTCSAIAAIASDKEAAIRLVEHGASRIMVELSRSKIPEICYHSLVCLCNLTGVGDTDAAKEAMESGAPGILVTLLYSDDQDIQECALSVIENICATNDEYGQSFGSIGVCDAITTILLSEPTSPYLIDAAIGSVVPLAKCPQNRVGFRTANTLQLLWKYVIGEAASTDTLVVRSCHALSILSLDSENAAYLLSVEAPLVISQLLKNCPRQEYSTILCELLQNVNAKS